MMSSAASAHVCQSRLSASRHFHAQVSELLLRIAPSSVSFTCIGVQDVRAYSYLRSTVGRGVTALLPPRWISQLVELLPPERQRPVRPQACVVRPSDLGPQFEPLDPDGRVLLVVLESGGVVHGLAGLERAAGAPEFSIAELDEIGALAGALSLAATYVLAVELLAYEQAAAQAGGGRSSLVMVADHDARRIIWARSTDRPVDWKRDVLPLQRALFERDGDAAASVAPRPGAPTMMASEIHDAALVHYGIIRVSLPSEPQLSRREREVAQLLVGGYANLNIAAHLGISENTIRTYIRRLYKKLKVSNRIDLIRVYEATS